MSFRLFVVHVGCYFFMLEMLQLMKGEVTVIDFCKYMYISQKKNFAQSFVFNRKCIIQNIRKQQIFVILNPKQS